MHTFGLQERSTGDEVSQDSLEFGISLLSSLVTELLDLAKDEDCLASKLPLPHGETEHWNRNAAAAYRVAADRLDREAERLRREEKRRQPPPIDLRGVTP